LSHFIGLGELDIYSVLDRETVADIQQFLQARPEALELLQWAIALQVCTTFELLEFGVIYFARDEADRLGHTRSVELLAAEEEKHIQLFRRYARHLRAQRPELAEQLTSLAAPGAEALRSVLHETALAQRHYVVWLNFLFFEEPVIRQAGGRESNRPGAALLRPPARRDPAHAADVRYLRAPISTRPSVGRSRLVHRLAGHNFRPTIASKAHDSYRNAPRAQ
jgi:hypothetical protein